MCKPLENQIILSEKDIERFWKHVNKKSEDECWEWGASRNPNGYGNIKVNYKIRKAHRISWTIHQGEIPEGLCVCHTCDTPSCVNPYHLFLGTHTDNMNDMNRKRRGVTFIGEQQGRHKLTEKEVVEIREKYIPFEYSARKLAEEYGVSQHTICCVVKRKTWKHVIEPKEEAAK